MFYFKPHVQGGWNNGYDIDIPRGLETKTASKTHIINSFNFLKCNLHSLIKFYLCSAILCLYFVPIKTGAETCIFCRIFVIIVVALFIAGAAMNTDQKRDRTTDKKCPVDPGSALFAAATVFSLVATGLQIASYVLLAPAKGSTKPLATQQQPEVAMGQPRQDADEVVAGGDPLPPSAPPLSQPTEPTSKV